MFGFLRIPLLLLAAFVAGVFYERDRRHDACIDQGGRWSEAGFCDRE